MDGSSKAGNFAGTHGLDPNGLSFFPSSRADQAAYDAGFRFGHVGTHTTRTMMAVELGTAFAVVPDTASRADYSAAIIDQNCLAKPTLATRRATNQRLGELYALDPTVPLFRVIRRLWGIDTAGRPLLALLCAIARDPLLGCSPELGAD